MKSPTAWAWCKPPSHGCTLSTREADLLAELETGDSGKIVPIKRKARV